MSVLIWAVYILLCIVTFLVLKNRAIENFSFSDGILIGLIYFLMIPMCIILFNGSLEADGIFADPYRPFDDVSTTLNIFIGWTTALFSTLFLDFFKKKQLAATVANKQLSIFYFRLMLALYVIFTFYGVYASGLGSEGSHWHGSTQLAFQSSSSFIFIKNFAGSYRVMIYGALVALYLTKVFSLKKCITIGLMVAIFDMAMTFNRILAVFFIISIVIVVKMRYKVAVVSMLVVLFPFISFFSNAWPYFRSTIFTDGLNGKSILNAWHVSVDNIQSAGLGTSDLLNGFFESSNIVVYNYIVNNIGATVPVLYGYTAILRPLTTFIPSTIWEDKPRVFGTYLGEIINATPGLALNSTLLGEMFANFYILWPIFLFLFIFIFDRLFNFINRFVPLANFMAVFVAIALWRFDANFASVALYSIGLLWVIKVIYFNLIKNLRI